MRYPVTLIPQRFYFVQQEHDYHPESEGKGALRRLRRRESTIVFLEKNFLLEDKVCGEKIGLAVADNVFNDSVVEVVVFRGHKGPD